MKDYKCRRERPARAGLKETYLLGCSSVNRPRRRSLLEPQPPLVILFHPKIGDVLIARRHAGSIALRHVNDAIVGHHGDLIVDRQHPQIVGVIILQFTLARAPQNLFFVVQLAFTADEDKIIGQGSFQEIDVPALLSLRDRVRVRNQSLLQRAERLGGIPRTLRKSGREKQMQSTPAIKAEFLISPPVSKIS